MIYKEKKERLERKERELYDFCEKDEPEVYLNLDLRGEVRREGSREKKQIVLSPKKEEEPRREEPRREEEE